MNKKRWMWLAVVVVVVLVLWTFTRKAPYSYNPSPSPTPTPSSVGGTAKQTLAYTKLVEQYAGKRIQFDTNCQAIPSSMVVKSGTKIMFDNRSGDARTIKIGGISYYFAGYGYRILTLSSPSLPKTLYLSCGSAVNVGTILLEK